MRPEGESSEWLQDPREASCMEWAIWQQLWLSTEKLILARREQRERTSCAHSLYSFSSIVAVTILYKLNALQQHKFVISHSCRSEVLQGSHWAKIKILARQYSFWNLQGSIYSLLFPASSRGYLHSLAYSSLKNHVITLGLSTKGCCHQTNANRNAQSRVQ